jgi:DNA-binding NarL/FixJ family response regulator
VLLSEGSVGQGLALLDEAMCAVAARELSALFTGWVYCLGLEACMGVADLRRAAEWTEGAMAWCDSQPAGTPFHGLCRVHRVEVLSLRGEWGRAQTEADLACDELLPNDPGVAAEAFYTAGEIRLRIGDLEAAEEAFRRAHELGRDPQTGLALLRLAEGKPAACAAALRLALAAEGHSHLGRARLLAAQAEVALATGESELARAACDKLDAIAAECGADLLHATAAMARGALLHAVGEPDHARPRLRRALGLWLQLGLPYEAARARMLLAAVSRAAGDRESARLELQAARAEFDRLGAVPDARRAAALLGGGGRLPGGLTQREAQVLRLVAAGKSNRSIGAELVISEHTVARHLNNIFAKLDVSSRSAATAFAFTHGLM